MFSSTERWNRTMSCGTTAMAARKESWVTASTGWPSIRTRPPWTSSSRWTSVTSVDLPAPDGPARPTFWPAGMRRSRPRKTCRPPGWAKTTSRNSMVPSWGTKGSASWRSGTACGRAMTRRVSPMRPRCWVREMSASARSREPCRMRKVSALTITTSPGVTRPRPHRWTAQASMAPATTQSATSWTTRAFSRCSQLLAWASASTAKRATRRPRSRSRAENALTAQMFETASTSSPPARPACPADARGRGPAPAPPGLLGERVVERPRPDGEAGEDADDAGDEQEQRRGQAPVDGEEDDQGAQEVGAGRGDVPHQGVRRGAEGAGDGRDPAAQRSRHVVGEVAHRLAGEVAEQVEPDVDPGGDDGAGGQPAGQAPEHALGRDQAHEDRERRPDGVRARPVRAHRVDQEAHPVLDRDGAERGGDDEREQGAEGEPATQHVVPDERDRVVGKGRRPDRPGFAAPAHVAPRLAAGAAASSRRSRSGTASTYTRDPFPRPPGGGEDDGALTPPSGTSTPGPGRDRRRPLPGRDATACRRERARPRTPGRVRSRSRVPHGKQVDTVGEVGGTPLGACILGPSARARRPHAARLPLDRATSPT